MVQFHPFQIPSLAKHMQRILEHCFAVIQPAGAISLVSRRSLQHLPDLAAEPISASGR